jgi:hypothetical protein
MKKAHPALLEEALPLALLTSRDLRLWNLEDLHIVTSVNHNITMEEESPIRHPIRILFDEIAGYILECGIQKPELKGKDESRFPLNIVAGLF